MQWVSVLSDSGPWPLGLFAKRIRFIFLGGFPVEPGHPLFSWIIRVVLERCME